VTVWRFMGSVRWMECSHGIRGGDGEEWREREKTNKGTGEVIRRRPVPVFCA
jgi:hypothetical protein